MNDIEFLIAVLFAAAVLVRLADLISIPYPIVLVVGGVAIGFVPGLPAIKLEPEAIFLIFLPPLLQSAGFNASPQELRAATAQLVSLTFALVLVTMAVVAVVAHAVIDGMSWQAAFVLGAILAPTDPVAAAAAFSRMGVPERDRARRRGRGDAQRRGRARRLQGRAWPRRHRARSRSDPGSWTSSPRPRAASRSASRSRGSASRSSASCPTSRSRSS